MEAPPPLSIPCFRQLFHLDVPELYPGILTLLVKCLSSVSLSSKLIRPKEGIIGNCSLQPSGQKHRCQPGPVIGICSGRWQQSED